MKHISTIYKLSKSKGKNIRKYIFFLCLEIKHLKILSIGMNWNIKQNWSIKYSLLLNQSIENCCIDSSIWICRNISRLQENVSILKISSSLRCLRQSRMQFTIEMINSIISKNLPRSRSRSNLHNNLIAIRI